MHVYEKETPLAPTPTPTVEKTTSWLDENGNPIKPTEKGTKDPGTIPGYELVRTYIDGNGNVRHVFRKVTPVEPKEAKVLPNTGSETSNTAAAGFGALIAGMAALVTRRRQKK